MVACAFTGNISGEATGPFGNILAEALRHKVMAAASSLFYEYSAPVINAR